VAFGVAPQGTQYVIRTVKVGFIATRASYGRVAAEVVEA